MAKKKANDFDEVEGEGGLNVETVPLAELHTDPQNARRHGAKNLKAICDSLDAYGQVEPLVVQASTGKVIGGNGRLEAMQALGWTHAQVAKVDFDDPKAMACAIALNRTAELAEWDVGTLVQHTDELADLGFDLEATGFDEQSLRTLARAHETETRKLNTPDEALDEVPEAPGVPVCVPGDVWTLGRHRLICGDSTLLTVIQKLCGGLSMDAVVTDPPYGVSYEKKQQSLLRAGKTSKAAVKEIKNDEFAGAEALQDLLDQSFGNAFSVCRDGAVWYVWAAPGPLFAVFSKTLSELGIWRQTIVWAKDVFVLGHSDYHWKHEPCFYGWKPGNHTKPPDRTSHTVWEFPRPKVTGDHPTMKPVELISRCVANSTHQDERVLEPFAGSGTTMIACETLGRSCYACEIDPRYCDVIIKRWEGLTGQKAERQAHAETVA